MTISEDTVFNDEEKEAKIKELQEIIRTAEETIFSAKQLLANLQPPSEQEEISIGREDEQEEIDGKVVYGYFDGQIMIGDDGKQYPVPANYASKSKLVEGDKLKLTITKDNRFMYKQIGPVQRNYFIGVVQKDERGNFTVKTASKEYKVLLAAATYFKIEPGDEVTLIVPQDKDTVWGAIENVLQKNSGQINTAPSSENDILTEKPLGTFTKPNPSANATGENESQEKQKKDADVDIDVDNEELQLFADLEGSLEDKSTDEQDATSNQDNSSALEQLEREIAKEKELQAQKTANKKSDENNNLIDDWETDIEKLKQEANVPITSNN